MPSEVFKIFSLQRSGRGSILQFVSHAMLIGSLSDIKMDQSDC